jgi:hypothetical protein
MIKYTYRRRDLNPQLTSATGCILTIKLLQFLIIEQDIKNKIKIKNKDNKNTPTCFIIFIKSL